jgi:hypothetical protein
LLLGSTTCKKRQYSEVARFEKILGMAQTHLSNPTSSKVQMAKPLPTFYFCNFSPPSELNNGA